MFQRNAKLHAKIHHNCIGMVPLNKDLEIHEIRIVLSNMSLIEKCFSLNKGTT